MTEKRSFIKQFWKEKRMVGSMVPSSRFLAKKMLQHIDFQNARIIVELGPGTGVFTRQILSKMHPDAHLLVFELNASFYEALKQNIHDPRLKLINDTAEKIEEYLELLKLDKADVVISSLPLANFPPKLRQSVIQATYRSLKQIGTYIQFQYSLNSRKQVKQTYKSVKVGFTPLNFPPAFIYTCRKREV
jgi:phospholipid N-methyltransferase